MNASYEELLTEIRLLRSEVASLKVENARLSEENAHLRDQLKLNSKNSSKPPSTDQKGKNDVPKKKGGLSPVTLDIFVLYFQQPRLMHLSIYEQKIAHPVEKQSNHQATHHR